MRRTARGFTMVEIAVALLIGVIALVVAFNAIILLTKGEKSTDRAASKALTDARLMATLLQDVRSSLSVTPNGADEFTVVRYVPGPATAGGTAGPLEKKSIVWKTINDPKNPRVTRLVQGDPRPVEFNYRGLYEKADGTPAAPGIDPMSPALKLRIQRLDSDVRFAIPQ
mgnify:CR=1 FL=1